MRVFLDANVLFSASQPESVFFRLIQAAIQHATVVTCDLAIAEARKNLTLKRPAWVKTFEALLDQLDMVPSTAFAFPVALDEKDIPLLCAAIHASCDYFVTGDRKDFGHLFGTSVCDVTVITPLQLAERLKKGAGE